MSHQAKSGVVVGIVVLAVGVGFWVSRKPAPEVLSPEAEVAQTDPASSGFSAGQAGSDAGRSPASQKAEGQFGRPSSSGQTPGGREDFARAGQMNSVQTTGQSSSDMKSVGKVAGSASVTTGSTGVSSDAKFKDSKSGESKFAASKAGVPSRAPSGAVVGSQVAGSQKVELQKTESGKPESPKKDEGLFTRLKTAVWNFVAPTQKETAKATEEILSKSSQGGFQNADGVAVKATDDGRTPSGDAEARALAKAAAEEEARARAEAEADLKAQKLAESQEAKRIQKLEAQLQRVSLDSSVLKVISALRKKDPQRAPLVEKYVRISLGGEDLEGDGFEALSEKYVEELNRDASASAALVFAGLKQAGMDDESQSVRTVLFSLANDLSAAKPEIGRAAWAELQNLAAPGGSQDVKATLAAYIAYSRTLPKGDKAANRALEEYIDELKDRDPVSAGVLKTRRSPASR